MSEAKTREKEKVRKPGRPEKTAGADYAPGSPVEPDLWRGKLETRAEMLKYLETAERYWFSSEWFGSEKRKNPA